MRANRNLAAKNHWKNRLAGFEFTRCFEYTENINPGQMSRPAEQTLTATGASFNLLEMLAESEADKHIILLSALGILAHKCSAASDICIFSPFPVRMNNLFQMSFSQFIIAVRENVTQDMKFANYPIEKIFNRKMEQLSGMPAIGLLVSEIPGSSTPDDMPVDLLFLFHIRGNLSVTVKYDENKFSLAYIEAISRLYFNLLDKLIRGKQRSIREIEIIPKEEKSRIQNDLDRTKKPFPRDKTILHLFVEQTDKNPGNIAVRSGNQELTYAELDTRANQVAHYITGKVTDRGSVIGVLMDRSIDLMIALFGIMKAGCIYLPLSGSYPPERIRYSLQDSGAALLFTDRKNFDTFSGEFLCAEVADTLSAASDNLNLARPEDVAYIMYTSGSTGRPKGVLIRHLSVVNRLNWMQNEYKLTQEDVILQKTPIVFDVSIWELFWWALCGAKLVMAEPGAEKDPAALIRLIADEGITVLHFVPSMLTAFVGYLIAEGLSPAGLKHLFASGEALGVRDAQQFLQCCPGGRLHNLYGPTEATVDVSFHEVSRLRKYDRIPIGKPIDNTTLLILNPDMQLQPAGIAGELYIGGENLAAGYLNQVELTCDRFVRNPFEPAAFLYKTGDLARWLDDGSIEYLGRIDSQVKIRGNRIELNEIEAVIKKYPGVKNAAVLMKEQNSANRLIAYIVKQSSFSEEGLMDLLRETLPDYMIPGNVVVINRIPLTVNGKVDRNELLAFDLPTGTDYVPPTTELQEKVLAIWQDVLGNKAIGITDNFFTSGGDSIKMISLAYKINKLLGTEIKVADLFTNVTVASLVNLLETNSTTTITRDIDQLKPEIDAIRSKVLADHAHRDSIEDVTIMSDIQKGMIYHYETNRKDSMYHDQLVFFVTIKNFDPALLKIVIGMMIRKHAILRTTFNIDRWDEFVQIIHKDAEIDYVHHSIEGVPKSEQEAYIADLMENDRKCPFQYRKGPLFRFRTIALGHDTISAISIFHHVILDGWSSASLLTEMSNTYAALQKDPAFRPRPLQTNYADFVIRELYEKRRPESIEFWKRELAGYKRLEFPTPTDAASYQKFGTEKYEFEPEFSVLIDKKHKGLGISIRNLCFSAYILALKMITYGNDLTVGLVINNRPEIEDGHRILGCFLNTIPFRVSVNAGDSYLEFVRRVNDKLSALSRYDRFPFYEIVKLQEEDFHNGNPIFDTKFNYTNFHVYDALENDNNILEKYGIEGYERNNTLCDFNVDRNDILSCNLIYSTKVITPEAAVELVGYFEKILRKIVDNAGEPINGTDILSENDKDLLLTEYTDTKEYFPKNVTLQDILTESVFRYSDSPAVRFKGDSMSYSELNRRSNQLARYLYKKGVLPQSVVAISTERSFEMIVGIFGILKAGCAYLPIDKNQPARRIEYILKDCGANILLIDAPGNLQLSSICEEIDISDYALYKDEPPGYLGTTARSGDVAYIIYTSGTTGNPKGTAVEHSAVINNLHWMQKKYPIDKNDVILQKTPFTFDVSVFEIFWWTFNGAQVVMLEKGHEKEPKKIVQAIEKHDISVIHFVPSMLNAWLNELETDGADISRIKTLRYVFASGEPLLPKHVDTFNTLCHKTNGSKLINLYGPTEATVHVTSFDCPTNGIVDLIPIGKPIDNIRFYILDENGMVLPAGVKGELCIAGCGLARGYINKPELTGEKFISHPWDSQDRLYKTGDLARWLPDGNIEYMGRIDNQVKINGNRVELGEVENAILTYPGIRETCAVVKNLNDGRILVAYFTSERELSAAGIREHLRTRLPEYMVPSRLIQLNDMPLTGHGKIDGKKIQSLTDVEKEEEDYQEPATELEIAVANIWSKVLGLERINTKTNFFDAGGHSLLVIKAAIRMKEAFGVEPDFADFINESFAEFVRNYNEKLQN